MRCSTRAPSSTMNASQTRSVVERGLRRRHRARAASTGPAIRSRRDVAPPRHVRGALPNASSTRSQKTPCSTRKPPRVVGEAKKSGVASARSDDRATTTTPRVPRDGRSRSPTRTRLRECQLGAGRVSASLAPDTTRAQGAGHRRRGRLSLRRRIAAPPARGRVIAEARKTRWATGDAASGFMKTRKIATSRSNRRAACGLWRARRAASATAPSGRNVGGGLRGGVRGNPKRTAASSSSKARKTSPVAPETARARCFTARRRIGAGDLSARASAKVDGTDVPRGARAPRPQAARAPRRDAPTLGGAAGGRRRRRSAAHRGVALAIGKRCALPRRRAGGWFACHGAQRRAGDARCSSTNRSKARRRCASAFRSGDARPRASLVRLRKERRRGPPTSGAARLAPARQKEPDCTHTSGSRSRTRVALERRSLQLARGIKPERINSLTHGARAANTTLVVLRNAHASRRADVDDVDVEQRAQQHPICRSPGCSTPPSSSSAPARLDATS